MTDAIAACNEMRSALMRAYRALPYKDYLRTDHWRAIRLAAIERSKGRCQLCGVCEKLHVHHITYQNLGDERPEDLTVVCAKCHAKFHEKDVPTVPSLPRGVAQAVASDPVAIPETIETSLPTGQSEGVIEVAWNHKILQYRQRPSFPCYIEYRLKEFGAMWQRLYDYPTPEAAHAYLMALLAPKQEAAP